VTVSETIDALTAALAVEREARQQAEARASSAEVLIAHYKLLIAKLRREQYGQSSERGRKLLDQLELQLEEAAASAAEDETAAAPAGSTTVHPITRKKPVRAPFPAHLPRERVVIPGPSACPCCGGRLAKLGETITETLEVVPRQWKVIQTVRREVHVSHLREDHPAAGTVPRHPARPCRAEPVGDGPICQIRRAPAAEPAERNLCP
jgi:transposase